MTLEKFKEETVIISNEKGNEIRKKYIQNFVSVESEYYREYIKNVKECIDGKCYTGYLWECLKYPMTISEKEGEKILRKYSDLYIMWDIHSCEKIFTDDYWKFGKENILLINSNLLLKGEKYLPEDIYIFDNTFEWTFIKTHEENDGERYCLINV